MIQTSVVTPIRRPRIHSVKKSIPNKPEEFKLFQHSDIDKIAERKRNSADAHGRRLILQTVTYKCCKEEKSNCSDKNDRRAAEPCVIPTIRLGKPAGNEN